MGIIWGGFLLCFVQSSFPLKVSGNKLLLRYIQSCFRCVALLSGTGGHSCSSPFWIGKEVMAVLRLRAGDEKTNVRKSALQVRWFSCASLFSVITRDAVSTVGAERSSAHL